MIEDIISTFMALSAIDSPSRHEKEAAMDLKKRLEALHFVVQFDAKGNLIAHVPATEDSKDLKPILFATHLDTVPNVVGVTPQLKHDILQSDKTTALGADDKAASATLLVALERLLATDTSHRAITVVSTVEEETGLHGAKELDMEMVGPFSEGYVLDASGEVGTAIISAPAKSDATITFIGKEAHAGFAPEEGISAISLAASAITKMKLLRIDEDTTANLGLIQGGTATNVVAPKCELTLEVRSSTSEKVKAHLAHIELCCIKAVGAVGGSYTFEVEELYPGYVIDNNDPLLTRFKQACSTLNLPFHTKATGGGSDTNILHHKGYPVMTVSVGYEHAHSVDESIHVSQLEKLGRLIMTLATQK